MTNMTSKLTSSSVWSVYSRLLVTCLLLGLGSTTAADAFEYQHGTSYLEPLKYKSGFTHFEWANPDAPKGGLLRAPEMGTFDSFNGILDKGRVANGVARFGGPRLDVADTWVDTPYGRSYVQPPKAGECAAGQRPGETSAEGGNKCSWRTVEVGKVVNASCLDGLVAGAVEHSSTAAQSCFASCRAAQPDRRRRPQQQEEARGVAASLEGSVARATVPPADWDECELNCFYTTLFGGKNGSSITAAAVPQPRRDGEPLSRAWDFHFISCT